jgi:hypothetical protein
MKKEGRLYAYCVLVCTRDEEMRQRESTRTLVKVARVDPQALMLILKRLISSCPVLSYIHILIKVIPACIYYLSYLLLPSPLARLKFYLKETKTKTETKTKVHVPRPTTPTPNDDNFQK